MFWEEFKFYFSNFEGPDPPISLSGIPMLITINSDWPRRKSAGTFSFSINEKILLIGWRH